MRFTLEWLAYPYERDRADGPFWETDPARRNEFALGLWMLREKVRLPEIQPTVIFARAWNKLYRPEGGAGFVDPHPWFCRRRTFDSNRKITPRFYSSLPETKIPLVYDYGEHEDVVYRTGMKFQVMWQRDVQGNGAVERRWLSYPSWRSAMRGSIKSRWAVWGLEEDDLVQVLSPNPKHAPLTVSADGSVVG